MKDGNRLSPVIDGKAVAVALRARISRDSAELARKPGLALIRVGEEPASASFVRAKARAAAECGFAVEEIVLDSADRVQTTISRLNHDDGIDGILLQLPLPGIIDPTSLLDHIDPAKDVDGLHPRNVAALWTGQPGLAACTPLGVMILLRHAGVAIQGAKALVVGRSNLVGRPMAAALLRADATVTIAHSKTCDLETLCRQADIIVSAAGVPKLIRAHWLAPGAVVIDVGLTYLSNGTPVGDVEFSGALGHVAAITPVPGGVGPMTIAALMLNTLAASAARQGKPLDPGLAAHLIMPPPHLSNPPEISLDQVEIRDLSLSMSIGLHPHERETRQPVVVSAVLACERRPTPGSRWPVVCYETIAEGIRELAEKSHVDLVEDFADRIAELCLADPRVRKAEIQVVKTCAILGTSGVGVRIIREA